MSDQKRNHLRSVNKFLLKKGIVTREIPLSIGQYIKAARLDFTDQFVTGYLAGFKKGSKGISILLALDKEEDIYELTNTKGGYFSSSMNGYPPPGKRENSFLLQVDWQTIVEVKTPEYDFPMMLTSSSLYIRDLAKRIHLESLKKEE
jgi:hypothetical protein